MGAPRSRKETAVTKALRVITAIAALAFMFVFSAAGTASASSTPRWIRHIHNYPGGISAGVRGMVSPAAVSARAQYGSQVRAPLPQFGPNVQMNDDSNPPLPQNETAVAYNVFNSRIAVAAANDYVSGGVVIMRTKDFGQHWASTRLTPQFDGTRDFCTGGDPAVAYSRRDRAFYLTQLCFFRSLPYSEVHLYVSLDNGATWTPGRQRALVASNYDYSTGTVDDSIFNDKEYLTVDNYPLSPNFGRIYVSYTKFHIQPDGFSDYCPIQLAYTDNVPAFDPSQTVFQHTAVVPDNPGGNGKGPSADQFSVPVVERDGSLDISYVTEECNTSIDHNFKFQKSFDGGATFLPHPVTLTSPATFKDNPDPADQLPPKHFRATNTESLAYSPATGTLVYMYTNYINMATSGGDIVAQRSTDGGFHWSAPQIVSQTPTGAPARNDQFFPWVATAPNGKSYAVWLDCRVTSNNRGIAAFQGDSLDDGLTWLNQRIGTKVWNPDRGFFSSGSFIGDYSGIAASNHAVYPVWTDGRASAIDRTGIGETDIFTNVEIQ
jgi:hypothetical protein